MRRVNDTISNRKDEKQQRRPGSSAKSPSPVSDRPRRSKASSALTPKKSAHELLELRGAAWLRVFGLEELNRAISALKVSDNSFVSVYNAFFRSAVDYDRFILSMKHLNQRNPEIHSCQPQAENCIESHIMLAVKAD